MSARASTVPFPEAVWDVALLRGLDARARAEIEAAGRLRRLRAGEVVHRAGEPADAVHVVASGRFSLVAVRRGEVDASVIRRSGPGELLGEEATAVDFGVYHMDARCDEDGAVADLPIPVLRRALGRANGGEAASRLERALRRAVTHDLLRTTSFTRALPARDVEVLVDSARHVRVPRGEHVYREGDLAEDAYLVADGLLQAQTEDDGRIRVEAYLSRGDLVGEAELEARDRRRLSVVACGPASLVAIPRDVFVAVARRNEDLLEGARRVRGGAEPRPPDGALTTAHVFKDLYRMRVARSLLVIDQDACVRCGHCAWSCASVHEDGVSRLVRHGERVDVMRAPEPSSGKKVTLPIFREQKAPLLVPNSCQHCKNPACMIDCPTGAIGRDARGEVTIREELCTGCGSCAKACPWDNISLAPRPDAKSPYPEVAVKCDLCATLPSGPACVASCPTAAVVRIDPSEAFAELRADASPASALPARSPAWPWAAGAALAGLGVPGLGLTPWTSGVFAGVLVALLALYAAVRRAPRALSRARRALGRPLHVAHVALGLLSAGVAFAHAGLRPSALVLSMTAALASGAAGVLAQAWLPRRLARLERRSVLPEELAARARELDDRVLSRLSGKSELVKTLYARALRPYASLTMGPFLLAVSGRTLRDEEARLAARLSALTGGRESDRARGLDELVRIVVERRALGAQRLLLLSLRAWVPVHVAASAATLVLLAAHVYAVVVRR